MPYKDKKKQAEYMREYRTAYMREYRKRQRQLRLNLEAEVRKTSPDIKKIQEIILGSKKRSVKTKRKK